MGNSTLEIDENRDASEQTTGSSDSEAKLCEEAQQQEKICLPSGGFEKWNPLLLGLPTSSSGSSDKLPGDAAESALPSGEATCAEFARESSNLDVLDPELQPLLCVRLSVSDPDVCEPA
eukprot:CAMPEP_0115401290 /NCGR_PEP_ID=MMETSP0271-20121206/15803_1 /TAXON_ID=71861 /ORGANISM="Scrippsiella trochoidea, Strain CCMP3099" /LENGTH=118 /DNA_ID=CAMNT_0002825183 /DNA_START=1028 /DNA_END=1385 /DNA_ORIENTATION=-